jgi:putative endonuclease
MPFSFLKRTNRAAGIAGEEEAVKRLRALGYRILDTNYRCRRGELDIVAETGGTLVFIEVKARTSTRFGTPFEAVDGRKRGRIIEAARAYLAERKLSGVPMRFDVVGVRLDREPPEVEVIVGAFEAPPWR